MGSTGFVVRGTCRQVLARGFFWAFVRTKDGESPCPAAMSLRNGGQGLPCRESDQPAAATDRMYSAEAMVG